MPTDERDYVERVLSDALGSDRPPRMFEPRLTLRGRIERRICADHLGGPCDLSKRLTATAIDEVAAWLAEQAERARELAAVDGELESIHATVLNALAKEARR